MLAHHTIYGNDFVFWLNYVSDDMNLKVNVMWTRLLLSLTVGFSVP